MERAQCSIPPIKLRNKAVTVWCDNEPVVWMIIQRKTPLKQTRLARNIKQTCPVTNRQLDSPVDRTHFYYHCRTKGRNPTRKARKTL